MKCTNCGTELPEEAVFCPHCGRLVTEPVGGDNTQNAGNPGGEPSCNPDIDEDINNRAQSGGNPGDNGCGRPGDPFGNPGGNPYGNPQDFRPPYPPRPPMRLDGYSVMSWVGFILSFFVAIAGLVVSIIAYNDAKMFGDIRSMGLSKAGIIISVIFIVLPVVLVILWICIILAGISMA